MVWKFSQQMPESDRDPHLKERLMQEICNDKLNSTYQVKIIASFTVPSITSYFGGVDAATQDKVAKIRGKTKEI